MIQNQNPEEVLQDFVPRIIAYLLEHRDEWSSSKRPYSVCCDLPETGYRASIAICHDYRHSVRAAVERAQTGMARMEFLLFSDDLDEIEAWLQTPEACQQALASLKSSLERGVEED